MNTKSHAGFWFMLMLVLFMVNPLLRSGESMRSFVSAEMALTRATFGGSTSSWLESKASFVFRSYTPERQVSEKLIGRAGMERSQRVAAGPGVALAKAFNSYLERIVLNTFVAIQRLFIFGIWFVILCPVVIAAVVDGLAQRAIKRAEFGAMRPAAYSLTSMLVVPMALAPLVYLFLPIPVSPLISPIWTAIIVLPLSLMVSNMQPIFGRN
jgi:hypothetical protein